MKANAVWTRCSDNSSREEHEMRDYCWNCAPYWDWVPRCPVDGQKLALSGYCKPCKKYYNIPVRPDQLEAERIKRERDDAFDTRLSEHRAKLD